MEYLKYVLIVYGIEGTITLALLFWIRFCDRKYSRRIK